LVTPLTGGDIDLRVLASAAMRELVRCECLLRFEVPIHDQPGALSAVADVLASEGASIVDLSRDRLSLSLNPKARRWNSSLRQRTAGMAPACLRR
jgi:threonine dehydratase